MNIAMTGDKIIPYEKLEPAYLDRGIYFGDGIYEVLRSYNANIFALDDHLERMANGLAAIEITGVDMTEIRERIIYALEQSKIANAKIYLHITRGCEPRNHVTRADLEPSFFLTVTELPAELGIEEKCIAVATHPDLRWKKCHIKSLNLLPNVLARMAAEKKGAGEAILVDDTGLITEGAGSSFFAVLNNTIRTAPLTANILPSVTRKYVLKAAKQLGLKIQEKSLTVDESIKANELFTTVTTKGIIPVTKFNEKPISNSKTGKQTTELTKKYQSYTG